MKYFTLIITAGVALCLSSCSFIETLMKKNKEVSKVTVLPQDREAIQKQATLKTFNPEGLARGEVRGDWSIEEVFGKKAKGETYPYLKLVSETHRAYGNNGCNTINATYKYNPQDSTIRFENMISTMMACGAEGLTDIDINSALDATRYYSWQLNDNDYYLYFYDANHSLLMTLMHQNFEFLNGSWKVVAIEDQPVDIEGMELVIDVDEGKVHGNTGCNVLNGVLETDMEEPNSLSFNAIAITQKLCPDMGDAQTRMIVALEDASRAKPVGPGKVLFLDSEGNVVLTLVRIQL